MNEYQPKKRRLSPRASVVITGWKDGHSYHTTEYSGSSLKAGPAFMRAIQKAQSDPTAEKVYYFHWEYRQKEDGNLEQINNEQAIIPIRETDVSEK
jgi:hypothetical protein